jgi:hypothetical protein
MTNDNSHGCNGGYLTWSALLVGAMLALASAPQPQGTIHGTGQCSVVPGIPARSDAEQRPRTTGAQRRHSLVSVHRRHGRYFGIAFGTLVASLVVPPHHPTAVLGCLERPPQAHWAGPPVAPRLAVGGGAGVGAGIGGGVGNRQFDGQQARRCGLGRCRRRWCRAAGGAGGGAR